MERLIKVLFFVGLFVYFVFLVAARAPAEWVAANLASIPVVNVGGATGTVWNGRVASATIEIYGDVVDLGAVRWKVKPLSLLTLNACADISSDRLNGHVCYSISGTSTLKQVLADQLPLHIAEKWLVAKLGGRADATIRHAVIGSKGEIKALDGNVNWQRARVNIGDGWHSLGSYGVDVTDNGQGGVKGKAFDLEGPFTVAIDGEVSLPDMQFTADGLITPKPEAPPQVVQGLSFITQGQEDGSFKVIWPQG